MDKKSSKKLAANLKKKSLSHFAFAPNGEEPFLLLGRKKWSAGMVKSAAEEEAGVVYKGGALFVGEVARDGKELTLKVDEKRSKGNLNTKKAMLGVRKLRKIMGSHGVRAPQLTTLTIQIGDAKEADATAAKGAKPVNLDQKLGAWIRDLFIVESELDMHPKTVPLKDVTRARLLESIRLVRDDVKLTADQLGDQLDDKQKGHLSTVRQQISDLQKRLDEAHVEKRKDFGKGISPVQPLARPVDLPDTMNTKVDELNDLLAKGGSNAKELSDRAYAFAQACLDERRKLERKATPFWKKESLQRKVAALVSMQQRATQAADAVLAEAAMNERSQEIHALFAKKENVKQSAVGINHAQIIKDDQGKVRYIAKLVDAKKKDGKSDERARRAKVKELGQEVASSAVADLLSSQLGIDRRVAQTTATVVETDGKKQMLCVQDAWNAKGDLSEALYAWVNFQGKRAKVTLPEVESIGSGDRGAIAKLLGKLGIAPGNDVEGALVAEVAKQVPNRRAFQWSRPPGEEGTPRRGCVGDVRVRPDPRPEGPQDREGRQRHARRGREGRQADTADRLRHGADVHRRRPQAGLWRLGRPGRRGHAHDRRPTRANRRHRSRCGGRSGEERRRPPPVHDRPGRRRPRRRAAQEAGAERAHDEAGGRTGPGPEGRREPARPGGLDGDERMGGPRRPEEGQGKPAAHLAGRHPRPDG